jgi:dTDP-4-dehydrorhamnose reductase
MTRVLVTGGTGFVGSNVVKLYAGWHGLDVTYTGRRPPEREMPGQFVALELTDAAAVRETVAAARPDVIVHTAILNDFGVIYADRRLAWDVYVGATHTIVDAANDVGAVVVFVSTDWVFDGTRSDSDENTPPNPINYYGVLKVAGELVTLERARHPIVARIAGVNGIPWAQHQSPRSQDAGFGHYVAALVDALEVGQPFTVWESESINDRATPSLASESAQMMLRLVETEQRGVFHCCGGESMTRMELARAAADVFRLDAELLRTGPPDPAGLLPAPIPRDTSLNARRTAGTIDYALPTVRKLLEAFKQQRETGVLAPLDTERHPSTRMGAGETAR